MHSFLLAQCHHLNLFLNGGRGVCFYTNDSQCAIHSTSEADVLPQPFIDILIICYLVIGGALLLTMMTLVSLMRPALGYKVILKQEPMSSGENSSL